MEEPRIIARLPDGRALYRVGTFDKRILALEIESHLRKGVVQIWEYALHHHPLNAFDSKLPD